METQSSIEEILCSLSYDLQLVSSQVEENTSPLVVDVSALEELATKISQHSAQ